MPNCDFYATPEDQRSILDRSFEDDLCDVFESYSEFDQSLRQFRSADEILGEYANVYPIGNPWTSIFLSRYGATCGCVRRAH